jgi:hypothetical protein
VRDCVGEAMSRDGAAARVGETGRDISAKHMPLAYDIPLAPIVGMCGLDGTYKRVCARDTNGLPECFEL